MRSIIQATLVAYSQQMALKEALEQMVKGGSVNVFNFDEPMHGDIFGFVLERGDCANDCCD